MAKYRNRTTGSVKNQGEWRKHFSNYSLPRTWNKETLDFLDLDVIKTTPPPDYDKSTQVVFMSGYVQDEDDNWVEEWTVRDFTEEELQQIEDTLASQQRSGRNQLLAETDWWAVSDRTMTAEETTYRQALRDITTHANWPNLAPEDWPTKPE